MQIHITGGRRLSRGALAATTHALETEVRRKELSAAARDCAKALGLRPTLRLILAELVGCFGGARVGGRMMVWPSTDYLMARTGLSERAVRYGTRRLIDLALVAPKDSANGKRFAVRAGDGAIVDAYGFGLDPLIARQAEWDALLTARREAAEARKRAFDDLTIQRRACEEALHALAQHYPRVARVSLASELEALTARAPARRGAAAPDQELLDAFADLRRRIEQTFMDAGNDGNPCPHIETNKGSTRDSCPKVAGKGDGAVLSSERKSAVPSPALIEEACPALADLGRRLHDEADIVGAGRFVRPSIGASADAWDEAVRLCGPLRAAACAIYVLQLHSDDVAEGGLRIRNPGGYFRRVARLASEGRIDLAAEFMRLRRRHMA